MTASLKQVSLWHGKGVLCQSLELIDGIWTSLMDLQESYVGSGHAGRLVASLPSVPLAVLRL